MTERENALLVYNHKIPEWIPICFDAVHYVGFVAGNECGSLGEEIRPNTRRDSFGVPWTFKGGATMPFPAHDKPLLEDIEKWREVVKVPDPETWDWEFLTSLEPELKYYDGTKLLVYFSEIGLFDRLTTLMGFENALCALITNPDEVNEIFAALADYKIKLIQLVKKFYNPDVFLYSDDLANSINTFMSLDTYRAIIKPHHARIIKAIHDNKMIAEQHTCGKFDTLADDYVDIGIQSFFPAHSTNDLLGIKKKYGDKVVINGGFNVQGPPGYIGASEECMRAEARRMIDTYAKGGGYIALPVILGGFSMSIPDTDTKKWFLDEFKKYSKDFYAKSENRVL